MPAPSPRLESIIRLLKKRWEDPEADMTVEAAIVGVVARGELDERKAAHWLSRIVESPQVATLLRDYASETWNEDGFKAIYRLYKDAQKESDGAEKTIGGTAARGQSTEADGARWLSRLVKSPQVATLLRDYAGDDWDEARFRELYRHYKGTGLIEDGLATLADAAWTREEPFRTAYDAGKALSVWGHDIHWRVRTLVECARRASFLPGDFVECGVDRGGTAMAVIRSLPPETFADRRFHLFDTFQGIVWSQLSEAEKGNAKSGDTRYPEVFPIVSATFAPFDFVTLVRGTVPETLDRYDGGAIAYLHIDMNASYPECAALEYFWPLLTPGAPVVFDDYGFPFHVEQRYALDALAARLNTSITALPSGQGLMWKV